MERLAAIFLLFAASGDATNWPKVAAWTTITVNVIDIKTEVSKSVRIYKKTKHVTVKIAKKIAGK